MKIYEFKGSVLEHWRPKKIVRNGNVHHNLRIGYYEKDCWEYIIGVDDNIVDLYNPPVPLESEYFLLNILSKKEADEKLRDGAGNNMYYIKDLVGHCEEHTSMLGLTLTSKKVVDIEILNDKGIERLGMYKQKFNKKTYELYVYIFKEGDKLEFNITTKEGLDKYTIVMRNKILISEKQE